MKRKFFNIAGPCHPDSHYMLPPLLRFPDAETLIRDSQFFVLHAPRQSGKTTFLQNLAEKLNNSGEFAALYCSLESFSVQTDAERGLLALCRDLFFKADRLFATGQELWKKINPDYPETALRDTLSLLSDALQKPFVLFFDEIDSLQGMALLFVLRQLREGYVERHNFPFPHSVALVGMRNIRDFKKELRDETETLGSASPFNISAGAFTLTNFTGEEIASLYRQHTDATGQQFSDEAVAMALNLTSGQPWLVNALADRCVRELHPDGTPIEAADIERAAGLLNRRWDTHFDSLIARLREKRVQQIVEPVLLGEEVPARQEWDSNRQYVLDLGLLIEKDGTLTPANRMYGEIMVRVLTNQLQQRLRLEVDTLPWVSDSGLDMGWLLEDFQRFFRENAEIWKEFYQYKEAAAHLVLTAFLQRVVNGGGQIEREYALGRMRLDLCILFKGERYAVELKLARQYKTPEKSHRQLWNYLDRLGLDEGWLVVFDETGGKSWEERLYRKEIEFEGKQLHLFGC